MAEPAQAQLIPDVVNLSHVWAILPAGKGLGMTRRERRFERQFRALERLFPPLRRPISHLRRGSWFPIRFPLALLLTAGGLFWFLPVLGLWMLPAGLLLLAIDLPHLRGPISMAMIRGRRTGQRWLRRWRDWRRS